MIADHHRNLGRVGKIVTFPICRRPSQTIGDLYGFGVFICRTNLRRSWTSEILDRLWFAQHMKTSIIDNSFKGKTSVPSLPLKQSLHYATDSLFNSVPLLDKIIKGFRSEKLTGVLSKGNPGPLCTSEEGHLGIEASCVLLLSLNQASGATAYAYKLSQDVLTNWKNKESCSVGKLEHFPIEFWKKSVIVLLFLYCALWLIRKSRDFVSCNFPRSIKRIQSAFKFSFPFKGKEVTLLSVPCRHSIE